MSLSAPASWSKSQNPYRTAPARRPRRHLVSLRDIRWTSPSSGGAGAAGGAGSACVPPSPPAVLLTQRTVPLIETPVSRRTRQLSAIDPKYVSQSGLCLSSDRETSRGSVRIQHLATAPPAGQPRFPKLQECAHFHYETVELGPILVQLHDGETRGGAGGGRTTDSEEAPTTTTNNSSSSASCAAAGGRQLMLQVTSHGRSWVLRRSYASLRQLDAQLHRCVYDRKYSRLCELPETQDADDDVEQLLETLVAEYLQRFSQIAGPLINCAPVLNWLELDNRGNRLLVADDSDINTPAVAAALVRKRYAAQASDEVNLEVGDMISVIDMAPAEESIWWRGKRGFEVGFFPSECVQLIGEKGTPQSQILPPPLPAAAGAAAAAITQPSRPVLRKHGKLIAFFRNFIQTRPSRRKLKQSGILKERVFGCDLGEHLLNSGREIPEVLKSCAEFVETHGIVDGIYRLSGVNSNIQRLRNTFDEERVPDLTDPSVRRDIHSVSCLLKQYLRELPNPLLTFQLHDKFVAAVQSGDSERLLNMRDVVRQLPPPHYRTLEYLVRHLARVSHHGSSTGMTPKNLAIVWAPNLVRSKELEVGGVAALQGVGVQAVVVEYLIRYCDLLFSDKLPAFHAEAGGSVRTPRRCRPKSLAISTPTKLLSLEEARSRALGTAVKTEQNYIEVGGGPSALPPKYHTVIELPHRKSGSMKFGKSPLGWRSLFRGRPTRTREQRKGSEPIDIALTDKTLTESDLTQSGVRVRRLRSVKSADSLVSLYQLENKAASRRSGMDTNTTGSPPISSQRSASASESAATDPVRHHGRSVSHDSYFQNLLQLKLPYCDEKLDEEEEEMNTQYCFDNSDLRVFSEDETMRATSESTTAGGRRYVRRAASPSRGRRDSRGEDAAAGKRPGSCRDRAGVSPAGRRRSGEMSPRVKVRRRASAETLTCSESTSVDVSSLRTDGSGGGALSSDPTPPAAAAHGCQVTADVHISPEPSTGADIGLLSPISEGGGGAVDVTEGDVSELAGSGSGLASPLPSDAEPPHSRISALVPEALEMLDRRLNSEQFRQAVAADAQRLLSEANSHEMDVSAAGWDDELAGVRPDWGQAVPVQFSPRHQSSVVIQPQHHLQREGDVEAGDRAAVDAAGPAAGYAPSRRSAADLDAAPLLSAAGSSPTRSCPAFSDGGTPSPLAVRYSLLSSALATPEFELSPPEESSDVSAAAATCSDTVNDRLMPSEAEQLTQSELQQRLSSPVPEPRAGRRSSGEKPPAGEPSVGILIDFDTELTDPPQPMPMGVTPTSSSALTSTNRDDIRVESCDPRVTSADLFTSEATAPTPESLILSAESSEIGDVEINTPAKTPCEYTVLKDISEPAYASENPGASSKPEGSKSPVFDRCQMVNTACEASSALADTIIASSITDRTILSESEALLPPYRSGSIENKLNIVTISSEIFRNRCSSNEQDLAVEQHSQIGEPVPANDNHVNIALCVDDSHATFPTVLSSLSPDPGMLIDPVPVCSSVNSQPTERFPADILLSDSNYGEFPPTELVAPVSRSVSVAREDFLQSVTSSLTSPLEEVCQFASSPVHPAAPAAISSVRENLQPGSFQAIPQSRDFEGDQQAAISMEGCPASTVVHATPARAGSVDIEDVTSPVSCFDQLVPDLPTPILPDNQRIEDTVFSDCTRHSSDFVAPERKRTAPMSVPCSEPCGGGRTAASWPGPSATVTPGGAKPTSDPPAWLRSDLRRLSDRRASVKQLLSKFEVKDADGTTAELAATPTAVAPVPAPRRLVPEAAVAKEASSASTPAPGLSSPERPRCLFAPRPFQRQLSDQTSTLPSTADQPAVMRSVSDRRTPANPLCSDQLRPLSDYSPIAVVRRSSDQPSFMRPLSSDYSAVVRPLSDQPVPVHITTNPLHAITALGSSKGQAPSSQSKHFRRSSASKVWADAESQESPTNTVSSTSAPSTPSVASPPSVVGHASPVKTREPVTPPAVARRMSMERVFSVDASPIGVVPSQIESSPPQPMLTDSSSSQIAEKVSASRVHMDDSTQYAKEVTLPANAATASGVLDTEKKSKVEEDDSAFITGGADDPQTNAGDGGNDRKSSLSLDPLSRERIERYKRERRSLLREKYKTESFKRDRSEILLGRRGDGESAGVRGGSGSPPPVFRRTASLRSPTSQTAPDSEILTSTCSKESAPLLSQSPPKGRLLPEDSPTDETGPPLSSFPTKEPCPVLSRSAVRDSTASVFRSPTKETAPVFSRFSNKETSLLSTKSPTKEPSRLSSRLPAKEPAAVLPRSSAKDSTPMVASSDTAGWRSTTKDAPVSLRWPSKETANIRIASFPRPADAVVGGTRTDVHCVPDVDARLAAARQRLSELRALSSPPGSPALSPEQSCDVTAARGTSHVSTV